MRRKVLGYEKTLDLLKSGYELRESPVSCSYYIYLDDEIATVRYDVLYKMYKNKIDLKRKYDGWISIYYLKESE